MIIRLPCQVLHNTPDFSEEDKRDRDSMISEELFINDLEKTNAVVAAFTVVGIFSLFFIEIGLTLVFMVIITNGDQLNERIAHSEFYGGWGKVFSHKQANCYRTVLRLPTMEDD